MQKSSKSRARRKPASKGVNDSRPAKPYPDYPLGFHVSGRITRKVKGKLHYFGRWGHKQGDRIVPVEDVEAACREALDEFNRQWPYLSEGKTPPEVDTSDGCTLKDLCNSFWRTKRAKLLAGELSPRTFQHYVDATDTIVAHFGKERRVDDLKPDDFGRLRSSLAERYGAHRLKSAINNIRSVFKYALDNRLITEPVLYGQSFDRPSAKTMRKARNDAGPRLFEADELRTILNVLDGKPVKVDGEDVALKPDPALRAMVLLGVNCGFGNTDVASLPQSAVDLDGGWINFPRPKTEIPRRVPLWDETVDAMRKAIAVRPGPAEPDCRELCFLTLRGNRWVRTQPHGKDETKVIPLDALGQKFAKLLKRLHINGRKGLGFYTLRHNFETIGGESRDQVAVNSIMGHVDSSMADAYRERISNERLRDVVGVVRKWLWNEST